MEISALFRLDAAFKHDPSIEAWMNRQNPALRAIAHQWFDRMRNCGDEVCEVLHDGGPVACFGNVPFAYVNAFTSHVNVGFYRGASLPDQMGLLQGTGRSMRHVKIRPGTTTDPAALSRLIDAAYSDIKERVENG